MTKVKIVLRILVSPIILALLIVTYLFHAIRRWVFFLRYGGEWINYDKDDHVTIEMCYRSLLMSRITFLKEKANDG